MRTTSRLGNALAYASENHGLLPAGVLQAAGLSPRQIAQLVRDGVLERILHGLYRLTGTRSAVQDVAAAVTRHRDAVASHTSALFIHGLDVEPPAIPHITLPPGSTSRARLGTLHRSPMDRSDRTIRQRIPVTSLPRSVVDAGETMTVEGLAAVVNEAVSQRMVTIPHIIDAAGRVEAAPGRVGSGRLRAVLATWTESLQPDSVAEAAAIRRIRTHGLPAPVTQHEIRDASGRFVARVDLAWPEHKVGREYQSVKWHRPDRIEPDENRLQALEALGWTVEPLFRYHLLPSEMQWLQTLDRQLRGARSQAS